MSYDPTLQAHLANTEERWGTPEENKKRLVTYGIKPLDRRLYGLNTDDGELILVIGEEKMRKTTFAINVIVNIMTAPKPLEKPYVVVDTLESGMPPERYTDQLISNMASRLLMNNGHVPVSHGNCPACNNNSLCKELRISPEFLKYNPRSAQQLHAINSAKELMQEWPIDIWGASMDEGDTRNMAGALTDKNARWEKLVEEKNAKIFLIDHVQQYRFSDLTYNDYEKLVRAVNAMGNFVAMHRTVVFLVSQISLTSLREAKSGGKKRAAGGKKPHEEANVIFSTEYEQESGQIGISLEASRKSGTGFWKVDLEDTSGALMERSNVLGF